MAEGQRVGGGFFDITGNLDRLVNDIERAKGLVKRGVSEMEKSAQIKISVDPKSVRVPPAAPESARPIRIQKEELDDVDEATRKIGDSLSRAQSLAGGFTRALVGIGAAVGGVAMMREFVQSGMALGEAEKNLAIASQRRGVSQDESSKFARSLFGDLHKLVATTEAETMAMVSLGLHSQMTFNEISDAAKSAAGIASAGAATWQHYFEQFAKARMFGGADFGLISPAVPGLPSAMKVSQAMQVGREMIPGAEEARKRDVERAKDIEKRWQEAKQKVGTGLMSGTFGAMDWAEKAIDDVGKYVEGGLTSLMDKTRKPHFLSTQENVADVFDAAARGARTFATPFAMSDDKFSISRKDIQDAPSSQTGQPDLRAMLEEMRRIFSPFEQAINKMLMKESNMVSPGGKRIPAGAFW